MNTMGFLSGTLENKAAMTSPTEKIRLAFLENGYAAEKIEEALVVKIGDLSQFIFQTRPGRILFESVILKMASNGKIAYHFVYRFWIQVVTHILVTAVVYFALLSKPDMMREDFFGSLVMINVLVLFLTFAGAQHARHYVLKIIKSSA